MSPIVSIIVPIYNVEKYLRECLDSILVQTFTDWECLLVDDGSPDKCGEICDEYAAKDKRFRVLHKENGGVSSARNLGLDKAKGEWVTFVDADDFLMPSFLQGLYHPIANGEDVDFVHGGCCNVKDGRIVSINQSYEYYIGNEPGIIFNRLRGLTVSKLFLLENVRNWSNGLSLRFDNRMIIAEDMAFTFDYLKVVNRYAFVPETGYCYRIDNISSATNSKRILPYEIELHSFKHLYNSIIDYKKIHVLNDNSCELRYSQLGNQLQNVILLLYKNNVSHKKRIESLHNDYAKEELLLLNYSTARITKRLPFMILRRSINLFDFIIALLHTLHIL